MDERLRKRMRWMRSGRGWKQAKMMVMVETWKQDRKSNAAQPCLLVARACAPCG